MTSQIRVDSIVPTTGVPTGGGGGIVQVVQGTTQTSVSVQTKTFTDTTLEATITPFSANHKILVIVNQLYYQIYSSGSSIGGAIRVVRNPGSNIVYVPREDTGPREEFVSTGAGPIQHMNTRTITFLDSPATTSAITYKTQGASYTTNTSTTFQPAGTVNNPTSYITLMEVSA